MDRLFIDTDIIFDLLTERPPFYFFAARLFTLAEKKKVTVYISSLCFNNLDYLFSKQYGRAESRRILSQFKLLVNVLSVDDKIINLALSSTFTDFEDAIQYYTATENNIPVLLTRNLKDYRDAAIVVMTAEAYLSRN